MKDYRRLIETAEYLRENRQLKLVLTDGCQLSIPVDRLQFEGANNVSFSAGQRPSDEQLSTVKPWGGGHSVFFPDCDEVFRLKDLEVGWYGDKTWMESLMVMT